METNTLPKQHTPLLAAGLLIVSACCAGALGGKDGVVSADKPQKVTVSGRVRLVGNSPMTSLVLSGREREWYIADGEKEKLMNLQHETVTVKAVEYFRDMVFANGLSAGRRYYLKKISIVNKRR